MNERKELLKMIERKEEEMKKNEKKSVFKKLGMMFCAAAMLIVFVTGIGAGIMCFGKNTDEQTEKTEDAVVMQNVVDLEPDMLECLKAARIKTETYVSDELDAWISEMMGRVDDGFLDDYFSFLNTKKRELLAVYNTIAHAVVKKLPSAEEKAVEDLEKMVDSCVVKSEISQLRIKNITDNAVKLYLRELNSQMKKVQEKYRIPQVQWNAYVQDLCSISENTPVGSFPMSMKITTVSGITLSGIIATPAIKKAACKVSARIAAKKAAETAGKASVKAISKISSACPYIGWGITIAVCIWDVADNRISAEKAKVQLRSDFKSYFAEVKNELMGSTENSIMGCITEWENDVKEKLENQKKGE